MIPLSSDRDPCLTCWSKGEGCKWCKYYKKDDNKYIYTINTNYIPAPAPEEKEDIGKSIAQFKELLDSINIMDTRKKEIINILEKPEDIWHLKVGNEYWVIDDEEGCAIKHIWEETIKDNNLREYGNCFICAKDALNELKKRKVETKLKYFSKDYKHKSKKNNWAIVYDKKSEKICIVQKDNIIYFDRKEDAEKAIQDIGKQRLIDEYFSI